MKKESHSIEYKRYEMQNYSKPNSEKMTQDEAKEIFRLRSKVTEVKANFRGKHGNMECEQCNEEETKEHILTCKNFNKHENVEKTPEFEEIYKWNVKRV